MLFSFIELAFPAPGNPYEAQGAERSIRLATASLIVVFPLFLALSMKLSREIRLEPARRLSSVRRWLIYLTMLVTSGFIIGDAITLIYNLLNGDLTVRFVLKVVVVAAITGTIFGYFLQITRRDKEELAS
jgi:Na+-transporting methylmalonyl-CoA/oxaloacetate decarboxylase beta subunit